MEQVAKHSQLVGAMNRELTNAAIPLPHLSQ
jgi:hypothetical protein